MALLPDVHVNLDRPTIQHIYQLFLPLVPGGALVIGLLSAHPDWFGRFGAASGVGYYSRIAGIIFLAYAVGLMLFLLSVHFGALLTYYLGNLCARSPKLRPIRTNLSISQNRVWRTVAAEFLGKQLAPTPPALPGVDLFTDTTNLPPPVPLSVQRYDVDWLDWYNVLQDFVLRGTPVLAPDVYFLFTIVQATGWAVIIVSFYSLLGRHHPVALSVVALLVLFTAMVQFMANYFYQQFDRLMPADFTARLLAEIRAREDANRGGAPPKPQ
jgi:hypothetical protein